MTTVAVVAHTRKQLGGGLTELRSVLLAHGIDAPLWYEVPKSKKAPDQVRAALISTAKDVTTARLMNASWVVEPNPQMSCRPLPERSSSP